MTNAVQSATLVHFSDLHLDSQFAWAGASSEASRKRREALRATLLNVCTLAREVKADALLCGGDLFEQERFTPDTCEFLRTAFGDINPMPVLLVPGNHDWLSRQSLYSLVDWSPN